MFEKLKASLGLNSARRRDERFEEEKRKQLKLLKAAQIGVFEDNIKNTELSHMTVEVTVYQGQGLNYEIALARFLKPEKEQAANLANSYSFELFQNILEEKINRVMYGAPIDTKNGMFQYFTVDGIDIKAVTDQDSFEVAINHLYHKRHMDEILAFTFKPETSVSPNFQLPMDFPEAEVDHVDAGTSPKGLGIVLEGQSLEFSRFSTSPPPQASKLSGTNVGTESSHERRLSGLSATTSSRPPTPKSPHSTQNNKSPGDQPKSKMSRTLSGVGTQIKKKLTGKETPVQKRERLSALWQEGERTIFKKGGEDEEEDDISKTAALEKDDDDDGGETEVEEEDEDISQEDRAITK